MVQAQHTREIQELKEQMGSGTREHVSHLQTQLVEHQRRTQDFEDLLRSQAKQASVQMGLQQVQNFKFTLNVFRIVTDAFETTLHDGTKPLQVHVFQIGKVT